MSENDETKQVTNWFIFQNDQLLVSTDSGEGKLLTSQQTIGFEHRFIRRYPLGEWLSHSICCAELSSDFILPSHFVPIPLRKGFDLLGPDWFGAAVKAYSVITWDKNHSYCGRCGQATIKHPTPSFERVCPTCHLHFYPRISPSVIVLIYRGDQIVMARSPHFSPGVYGLIAGFVEVGETLEEAVMRETKEEVGLQIKNLRYFGSQPWPFPDSLMVAFIAEYASGDLIIDPTEIEDGGWYDINKLPGRPSSQTSIASQLINYFITQRRTNTHGSL